MTEENPFVLNVASSLDIGEDKSQLDTVDKNIKVLITKLKGTHMNEGKHTGCPLKNGGLRILNRFDSYC